MQELFVFGRQRYGEKVRQDIEGQVAWHGIACCVVEWEGHEDEEDSVGYSIKIGVYKECPSLGASERQWCLCDLTR